MFEIYIDDKHFFKLTFVERIKEPECREYDEINCWLEVTIPCIELKCLCEFLPGDLVKFHLGLAEFYSTFLRQNRKPKDVIFESMRGILKLKITASKDIRFIHCGFTVMPDIETGSELKSGIYIDQSYFPQLLAGLQDIIESDQD